jgi:aminoglycoside phosphotransferase (APT) family kinase protein
VDRVTNGPIQIPEPEVLARGLRSIFRADSLAVLHRQPNVYSSTYASEIVTCRLPGGDERRLLCKYGAFDSRSGYGHRAGLSHEVLVHREVLAPLSLSSPTFYGAHTETSTGELWLVVGYLDGALHVSKTPGAMRLAARWIGEFHAANAARLGTSLPDWPVYDAAYYRGWAERTLAFARRRRQPMPWLNTLCARLDQASEVLLATRATVVHGEYYVHNILHRDGAIFPVDWESAALAPGEIDLASLTEAWDPRTVRECELEYQRARWPDGPPPEFEATLSAARLYWTFRWAGDPESWDTYRARVTSAEQLRLAAERLGLVGTRATS